MKKKYVYFILFSLIFSACESDFDVNDQWEEVTVVYGLLDQSRDQQYIKINKAFLGKADALQMASNADSSNYNPDDLSVKLYQSDAVSGIYDTSFSYLTVDNQVYKLGESLEFHDTIIEKDEGLFATDNNIIYTAPTNQTFFNKNKTFVLVIINKKTGNIVKAITQLIGGLTIANSYIFDNPFVFYIPGNADPFRSVTALWPESQNGTIYQVELDFNYSEDSQFKSVTMKLPLISYDGRDMTASIKGKDFFSFLSNNIAENPDVVRTINNLTLKVVVGTEELATYINVNKPISGIVQERPQYSNIDNGIGLFSSRYIGEYEGIPLSDGTRGFIRDSLNLNFQN